jgi:hypothetical protein
LFEGPSDKAPARVKIFQNQVSFDFSNAENTPPVQELVLTAEDVKQGAGKLIPLRYVKFQNVNSITVSTLSVSI